MNFYQIKEPYSATIVAHDEMECLKLYEENMSDVGDKDTFFSELTVIPGMRALTKLAGAWDDIPSGQRIGFEDAVILLGKFLEEDESAVLVMEML
ncbi:MAG TPA: hypothetical protein H9948_06680 [Candidatus Jeotgalibaca merdavium]|uniref:Uncharacterized protein n=1 Tax=Candidatus Jeotgalibaca merdavium TaxID=2838627 RepID=A0A9D2I267_9LACT|nr:hypothetical protein [Candidatus Jeotgalibaca merdavium]